MVEYGEHFWQDRWGPLYSVFGGNPLAAMPSLHFATSLMAALLLAEAGPLAGALGAAYTATLGFALVYLGEHYVVDLLAGAALTGAVRRLAPRVAPLAGRIAGDGRGAWRRSRTKGGRGGRERQAPASCAPTQAARRLRTTTRCRAWPSRAARRSPSACSC